MVDDFQLQADKLYRQLLDLLEEIRDLHTEAAEMEDDGDEGSPLGARESLEAIVEEAEERGMDGDMAEKIFREVMTFAKAARGK